MSDLSLQVSLCYRTDIENTCVFVKFMIVQKCLTALCMKLKTFKLSIIQKYETFLFLPYRFIAIILSSPIWKEGVGNVSMFIY